MEALWDSRHQVNNLVGTVINVHNGQWTRKGMYEYYMLILNVHILK